MPAPLILTYEEFLARHDERDVLAVAGLGGANSSAGQTINEEKVREALKRAHDFAASMVMARYPFLSDLGSDAMPPALKGAVDDLAWYWLRDREGDRGNVDKNIRDRFDDARAWLKDISKTKADLVIDSDGDGKPDHSLAASGGIYADFPDERSTEILGGYR